MAPTKSGSTVKKAAPAKAAAKKSAVKKAAPAKAAAKKSAVKNAAARKSTSSRGPQRPMRRELTTLVNDVRTALDELAVKGDLATMEGRDRLHEQVIEIENRWLRVKQELGLARSDADSTVETLRSAISRAEDAMRHIFDAALEGLRKP